MNFLLTFLIWCVQLISVNASVLIPQWSNNYHLKGTLHVPEASVIEPFEVWYDRKSQKSRVDFYYGMVKTFQTYDYYDNGAEYKIFPYTDEEKLNVDECLKQVGTEMRNIELQAALYPIEDMFEFSGMVNMNGEKVQKWTRFERGYGPAMNNMLNFDFYTKCEDDDWAMFRTPKCTPLRLRMHGRNLIFQSHAGNYTIDYHLYEPDIVTADVFQINFPVCTDIDSINESKSYRSVNPLSTLLPSLSTIVNEDRGFNAFTKKYGHGFASVQEFRKRFSDFKQKSSRKYKRKRDRFLNLQKFNFTTFNKRIRNSRLSLSKNKRKMLLDIEERFRYTDEQAERVQDVESFDLNKMGAMQPVQSQLHCGSCWAFATVAALEGAYFIKYRKRVKLSEQALIDCSWGFQNLGCDGGSEKLAMQWIKKHNGIPLHNDYGPYKATNGYCLNQNDTEKIRVLKYKLIPSGDYRAIQVALMTNGPVLAGMYGSLMSLAYYTDGIYNDPDCKTSSKSLDHAVVIVGFGYYKQNLYWIVRNSWSKSWGVNGHFKIMATNNVCGLSSAAVSVIVD